LLTCCEICFRICILSIVVLALDQERGHLSTSTLAPGSLFDEVLEPLARRLARCLRIFIETSKAIDMPEAPVIISGVDTLAHATSIIASIMSGILRAMIRAMVVGAIVCMALLSHSVQWRP
tara:strand:+ start:1027 stop:1389 length:363 start_codon:yes stop_codon:yes gene_type:complete